MIRRVIVLGGGSAGLMAALALRHRHPALPVLLIRSRDIGVIGVGEGSTVALTRFLHQYLRINLKAFHEIAQPTFKLGLKFIWGPRPHFFYGFGPEQMSHRPAALSRAIGYYCDDTIDDADPITAMMARDRVFARQASGLPAFHDAFSYHFENEKFVRFLEGAAAAAGVEIADDTVARVLQDDRGVASLELKSGRAAAADLYVDCSGFASLLLGKAMREPFISYKPSLFCDRAVIGGWDRADEPIHPYTTCQTMEAGWCWQIEHVNRINRGYVYCSSFISDEQAEREFRAANPRVSTTRVVRFASGRYERAWVKNVVAIGNASGFVEPLEATALGGIATQSRLLADTLLDTGGELRGTQIEEFNNYNAREWETIRGFIALHYKFNTRLQTPFWIACREKTDLASAGRVARYYQENGPSAAWAGTMFDSFDQFGVGGYMTLLVGQRVPYDATHQVTDAERMSLESHRQRNAAIAANALSVREVLDLINDPRWRWGAQ